MMMIVSTLSRRFADPELRLVGTLLALERERAGHDSNRERAEFARYLGDHRRAPGAGAATLAGGHEHHVGALQGLLQLVTALGRSLVPCRGIGPGAQAARGLRADVQLHVRLAHQQRLRIGVDREELHAFQAGVDHPRHGIRPAAAHADAP